MTEQTPTQPLGHAHAPPKTPQSVTPASLQTQSNNQPHAHPHSQPASTPAPVKHQERREGFQPDELAIVLSYYNVGIIKSITEFPRGSRKAPKLIVESDSGRFLLKRRAKGKDDPFKVAFCHSLQLHLAANQFPLPHLVGTRNDNNSMLQLRGAIYELFEFVKGANYDYSLEANQESGKTLALFHKLMADHQPQYTPPHGSYHASKTVTSSLETIPQTLAAAQPRSQQENRDILKLIQSLIASYTLAAEQANQLGLMDWPTRVIHGDWHPGNLLFQGPRVVAVIDYDSARLQQRILDIANAALQFSIIGGGGDVSQWADHIDELRFKRFLNSYDGAPDCTLSRAEINAIPYLMIQVLVAQSAVPIAATGSFSRLDGLAFLHMVKRKTRWIQENYTRLTNVLDS